MTYQTRLEYAQDQGIIIDTLTRVCDGCNEELPYLIILNTPAGDVCNLCADEMGLKECGNCGEIDKPDSSNICRHCQHAL